MMWRYAYLLQKTRRMKEGSTKAILANSSDVFAALTVETALVGEHSSGNAAAERQTEMKSVGAASAAAAKMAKSAVPFNLVAVQMATMS